MEVANITSGLSAANLSTLIGVAVLNQNMEAIEAAGEGMLKILESADITSRAAMEQSVYPHVGGNLDLFI